MSESGSKNEKYLSVHFLCLSNVHTLKTICGKTLPENHAALFEVFEMYTVDRSSMQKWH